MKIVYGTGKTSLMVGVDRMGSGHAPFIGFVDADVIKDRDGFNGGKMAVDEIAAVVEASGGVMVYIENREAAETMMQMLMVVFSNASEIDWNENEGVMQ